MKVVWQDAYTSTKTELNQVTKELGRVAITTSYGKKPMKIKNLSSSAKIGLPTLIIAEII